MQAVDVVAHELLIIDKKQHRHQNKGQHHAVQNLPYNIICWALAIGLVALSIGYVATSFVFV